MKIEYDSEGDVLYLRLRNTRPNHGKDLTEGVTADLDDQGYLVGIEILDASERLGTRSLHTLTVEELPISVSIKRAALRSKRATG